MSHALHVLMNQQWVSATFTSPTSGPKTAYADKGCEDVQGAKPGCGLPNSRRESATLGCSPAGIARNPHDYGSHLASASDTRTIHCPM